MMMLSTTRIRPRPTTGQKDNIASKKKQLSFIFPNIPRVSSTISTTALSSTSSFTSTCKSTIHPELQKETFLLQKETFQSLFISFKSLSVCVYIYIYISVSRPKLAAMILEVRDETDMDLTGGLFLLRDVSNGLIPWPHHGKSSCLGFWNSSTLEVHYIVYKPWWENVIKLKNPRIMKLDHWLGWRHLVLFSNCDENLGRNDILLRS